ncbi:uncharacterized protein [Physcomitrium patens]|uniref:Uncharacterized protein n=1 Tax=Physcomitrium patens TaxID=3218 RepID=A0A2K1KPM7_PHYPA|nr:uncharacterized protein LOC112281234 [Physcomitrium patens]PNR55745.1 hypothetical protein PHYPA_006642 [Physcomitrium patens]|eukprot:XP_024373284.1 uncharacterized protein LOC112281234 [Physcomitrella patens]
MNPAIFPLLLVLGAAMVTADSVVEELEKHGLPVGLLPSSVKSYSISEDGDFCVALQSSCYAKIEDQLAYYSRNITGQLKFGTISNLNGIETKQLFVWLPVTGIYVDVPATPYIYLEVGVLTKRLALAVFETPPKCSSHDADTGIHIPNLNEFAGFRLRKALH